MKKLLKSIVIFITLVLVMGPIMGLTAAAQAAQANIVNSFDFPMPVASGINVRRGGNAELDYSNVADGYVMARFNQHSSSVRILITNPSGVRYQYNLNTQGRWETFPLTGGNGVYTIIIAERIDGNRYSPRVNMTVNVVLVDEFAPFLRPNQFVNFGPNSNVVAVAAELTQHSIGVLDSVAIIYNFVINNISYDFHLATTVQSGYVPDLDIVLARGMGICFDYASLMTAMLRSRGIPTKLVIGYVGDIFHAWISVHSDEHGWINDIIRFDGLEWRLMDPTFSSTGGDQARQFTGNGQNHRPTNLH
ncbi:MAG: transglutaminase-like domain-containing protein [Defluviitaleaceae bacterium]|nr:transglutaminase-like domain-containing protein [Defluviitaleaceae bacterium]